MFLNICIFSAILLGTFYPLSGTFQLVFESVYGFELWQRRSLFPEPVRRDALCHILRFFLASQQKMAYVLAIFRTQCGQGESIKTFLFPFYHAKVQSKRQITWFKTKRRIQKHSNHHD